MPGAAARTAASDVGLYESSQPREQQRCTTKRATASSQLPLGRHVVARLIGISISGVAPCWYDAGRRFVRRGAVPDVGSWR